MILLHIQQIDNIILMETLSATVNAIFWLQAVSTGKFLQRPALKIRLIANGIFLTFL